MIGSTNIKCLIQNREGTVSDTLCKVNQSDDWHYLHTLTNRSMLQAIIIQKGNYYPVSLKNIDLQNGQTIITWDVIDQSDVFNICIA